jgi:hypothetical protein
MKYTVRYAHLSIVSVSVGQLLKEGDAIGRMGNTGQSTGAHLHIDCVRGRQDKIYTQAEIDAGKYVSDVKQLNHFIDKGLFGVAPKITTYYCEPEYAKQFGKLHYGYDVMPSSGAGNIFWNRSKIGSVSVVFENHAAYGNCVYVTFEA